MSRLKLIDIPVPIRRKINLIGTSLHLKINVTEFDSPMYNSLKHHFHVKIDILIVNYRNSNLLEPEVIFGTTRLLNFNPITDLSIEYRHFFEKNLCLSLSTLDLNDKNAFIHLEYLNSKLLLQQVHEINLGFNQINQQYQRDSILTIDQLLE